MGTTKLGEKLEKFLDLSQSKQRKRHDKLLKIIRELEEKKSRLEQKLQEERELDANGDRCQGLERKLQVISGLISKAKQKDLAD